MFRLIVEVVLIGSSFGLGYYTKGALGPKIDAAVQALKGK